MAFGSHLQMNAYMEGSAQRGLFAMPRQPGGLALLDSAASIATGVSSFAFQGTNAHAAMEVLDSDDPQSVFGSGRHVGHTWRRTPFWLLPPASALLRSCSVGAAGAGAARQVLMQGQLRSAGLAELLLSGGSAPWARICRYCTPWPN